MGSRENSSGGGHDDNKGGTKRLHDSPGEDAEQKFKRLHLNDENNDLHNNQFDTYNNNHTSSLFNNPLTQSVHNNNNISVYSGNNSVNSVESTFIDQDPSSPYYINNLLLRQLHAERMNRSTHR
eukprot:TRINITY_DN1502_c0_g1_i4.p1 TRINITY_DN1502_c0_g1~~TRINITY_DN1502_c0_g1_i4.p1  ORF type:complete len:124 (-),score=36.05 TRINITY_DN1502_c0_g1_i4:132-503(-)